MKRAAALPDVPTLDELGIKGQEAETMQGVLAPAGTPKEIVDLLQREIAAILATPDVKEKMLALGFEPSGITPAEFAAYIKAEIAKWRGEGHVEDAAHSEDLTTAMADTARIVICGAGIAGVAAAYYLAVEHGLDHVTIGRQGNPLSLTSDKSTEAYRNWWPGPDWAMTAFMNRSIDLIEGIARATDNRINLNRRGYVFATADAGKIRFPRDDGEIRRGARRRRRQRFHDTAQSAYTPSPERGFDDARSRARTSSPMRA